jgi:cell division protein DivIC
MRFKDLKQKWWFRFLSNKHILLLIIFAVWMFFFDSNSWFIHHELSNEISDLEKNKDYYKEEIAKDKTTIKTLEDSVEIEKFAREEYYMKRENEEIFIIEYEDSIQ